MKEDSEERKVKGMEGGRSEERKERGSKNGKSKQNSKLPENRKS